MIQLPARMVEFDVCAACSDHCRVTVPVVAPATTVPFTKYASFPPFPGIVEDT